MECPDERAAGDTYGRCGNLLRAAVFTYFLSWEAVFTNGGHAFLPVALHQNVWQQAIRVQHSRAAQEIASSRHHMAPQKTSIHAIVYNLNG